MKETVKKVINKLKKVSAGDMKAFQQKGFSKPKGFKGAKK